jgi:N-acetylneuraminic acid mutarotase
MRVRSLPFAVIPLALAGLLCAAEAPKFDPLPHKVSSLGACVSDGYVYVYGGHTGATHTYSTETTTDKFFRAKLTGGKWEELTAGPPAQGLALVAYKGKVYRVGGMQPRNKPKEKADSHSLTSFAAYDPSTKKWQELTALPEGRSSHDAVVVGDKLYVFGGWKMNGEGKEPTWHKTGLVMDLSKAQLKWQSIEQPFQRRALAVEALGGKVYVLGGLTAKDSTVRVDVYDPKTEKWSEGVSLPSKSTSMGTGFSPAACVQGGRLYVSTNDGLIHRLSKDGKKWEEAGKQHLARIVPRLVAGEKGELLVIGGNAKGEPKAVEVIAVK